MFGSASRATSGEHWITNNVVFNTSSNAVHGNDTVWVSSQDGVLTLEPSATHGTLESYCFGNLYVTNGGTIECRSQGDMPPHDTNAQGVAIMVAGDLIVGEDSSITATGQGFVHLQGPAPADNQPGLTQHASHGGQGYLNPVVYGSPTEPTTLGSGGRNGGNNGGGAICLDVGRALALNGRIEANGMWTSSSSYGASAGGSVRIRAAHLTGHGLITANGGTSPESTVGAGGGRIAVYYRNNSFADLPPPGLYTGEQAVSASVTVKGGYNRDADGLEDGSLCVGIRKAGPKAAVLIVR
ncbi:hypothetical protein ACFLSJ_01305 [Verrucomicrobiota bacterium]